MAKIIMMRGLPGSGKSTKAKEILQASGNTIRVNRDLLRTMLHFDKFTLQNEKLTRIAEIALTKTFIAAGKNVIVDDTNFKNEAMWLNLANELHSKFEVISVNTSIDECIARDSVRDKKVGRWVILNMAKQNGLLCNDKKDIIVDIDGTLADLTHRKHFIEGDSRDYKSFFDELIHDVPRHEIIEKVKEKAKQCNVYIVSGRPDSHREQTVAWLQSNNVPFITLLMRRAGDHRPDTEVKQEILNTYFNKNNVELVIDDRPCVIRMWRENGLTVDDVGNGIEF